MVLMKVIITLLASNPNSGELGDVNGRVRTGIFTQATVDPALSYALSFAPPSGLGMPAECSGTIPTGAQGETVTYTRTSPTSCTKRDGTVVQLAANQPPVQSRPFLGSGPLGVTVDEGFTERAIRTEEFDNAAWVSTAAVSADAITSPDGTQDGETLTDSSAVVLQSSCQVLSNVSTASPNFSVYVKPGSVSSLTLSITGTGDSAADRTCTIASIAASCPGLANGWYRCGCVGRSVWGATITAKTFCVGVGDSAGVQGTVSVWGANFVQLTTTPGSIESYVKATSAAIAGGNPTFTLPNPAAFSNTQGCMAATTYQVSYDGETNISSRSPFSSSPGSKSYFATASSMCSDDEASAVTCRTGLASMVNRAMRFVMGWSGSALTATVDGATATGTYDGTIKGTAINPGNRGASVTQYLDGWVTNLQVGATTSECTP